MGNNPVTGVDPSGLDILLAVRKATGFPFTTFDANHVYLWSTVYARGEGTGGSSGTHSGAAETAPSPGNYVRISGLSAKEELAIIDRMANVKDTGIYIPYINDCFTKAQNVIDYFKLGVEIPWSRTGQIKPVSDTTTAAIDPPTSSMTSGYSSTK